VWDALISAGTPLRNADLAAATGLGSGTVSKAVGRLLGTGKLTKNPDGTISPSGH
jgi:predicted transcriptional regulator